MGNLQAARRAGDLQELVRHFDVLSQRGPRRHGVPRTVVTVRTTTIAGLALCRGMMCISSRSDRLLLECSPLGGQEAPTPGKGRLRMGIPPPGPFSSWREEIPPDHIVPAAVANSLSIADIMVDLRLREPRKSTGEDWLA